MEIYVVKDDGVFLGFWMDKNKAIEKANALRSAMGSNGKFAIKIELWREGVCYNFEDVEF